jgi:hypothetical protein
MHHNQDTPHIHKGVYIEEPGSGTFRGINPRRNIRPLIKRVHPQMRKKNTYITERNGIYTP